MFVKKKDDINSHQKWKRRISKQANAHRKRDNARTREREREGGRGGECAREREKTTKPFANGTNDINSTLRALA
jgi:hypothetical protein